MTSKNLIVQYDSNHVCSFVHVPSLGTSCVVALHLHKLKTRKQLYMDRLEFQLLQIWRDQDINLPYMVWWCQPSYSDDITSEYTIYIGT